MCWQWHSPRSGRSARRCRRPPCAPRRACSCINNWLRSATVVAALRRSVCNRVLSRTLFKEAASRVLYEDDFATILLRVTQVSVRNCFPKSSVPGPSWAELGGGKGALCTDPPRSGSGICTCACRLVRVRSDMADSEEREGKPSSQSACVSISAKVTSTMVSVVSLQSEALLSTGS